MARRRRGCFDVSFDALLVRHAGLCAARLGREQVQYRGANGVVTLTVHVERGQLEPQSEESRRSVDRSIRVFVDRNQLALVRPREDTILLPVDVGTAATWLPVQAILEQDAGGTWMAVGR
jgi:hypothetical protein